MFELIGALHILLKQPQYSSEKTFTDCAEANGWRTGGQQGMKVCGREDNENIIKCTKCSSHSVVYVAVSSIFNCIQIHCAPCPNFHLAG